MPIIIKNEGKSDRLSRLQRVQQPPDPTQQLLDQIPNKPPKLIRQSAIDLTHLSELVDQLEANMKSKKKKVPKSPPMINQDTMRRAINKPKPDPPKWR